MWNTLETTVSYKARARLTPTLTHVVTYELVTSGAEDRAMSIGVLYFQINQYRDALDAHSRANAINAHARAAELNQGNAVIQSLVNCICSSIYDIHRQRRYRHPATRCSRSAGYSSYCICEWHPVYHPYPSQGEVPRHPHINAAETSLAPF